MTQNVYARRLTAVRHAMQEQGAAAVFLPVGANLEYLTGERRPRAFPTSFLWPGGWITGVWITLDRAPTFTVPRMAADYDLVNAPGWPVRVLNDDEDPAAFLHRLGDDFRLAGGRVAIDDRTWARFTMDLQRALPTVRDH
jgi:Xaa-Pro aminopeptidase